MKKYSEGGIVAWIALAIGAVFLVALFVFNTVNKPPSPHLANGFWSDKMVQGNKEAPNKLVEYTDYFCSFCAEFQEPTVTNKFQNDYIENGKLSYEARIITVLKELSPNTEQGAEAAHCAADQDKFWEYSEHIVPRIKKDFFEKGIGVKNVANPVPIEKLSLSYFGESAKALDMDVDKFTTCIKDKTHGKQIAADTERAISLGVTGLPFIVVNDYTSSGFQGGYQGLEMILKAGGVN